MPSPQLLALEKALEAHYATPESSANRFRHYASLGRWMRGELRRSGLSPLVSEAVSAPTIATFTLPDARCAERCREAGYQIAHESGYLKERSWGQISVMGDLDKRRIAPVFAALRVESGTS
jgi:aspartate aminotransferase-like enzyme